jgi:hypothetical protein
MHKSVTSQAREITKEGLDFGAQKVHPLHE